MLKTRQPLRHCTNACEIHRPSVSLVCSLARCLSPLRSYPLCHSTTLRRSISNPVKCCSSTMPQSATYKKLHVTATEFIQSYNKAFSRKDASFLSTTLSPECIRTVLPSSFLASLGRENKPISNTAYEAIVKSEFPAFQSQNIQLNRLAIDDVQKSAFLLISIEVTLLDAQTYNLDFAFLIEMTDSSDKIKAVTQFLDTAKCVEARGKIDAILKELGSLDS